MLPNLSFNGGARRPFLRALCLILLGLCAFVGAAQAQQKAQQKIEQKGQEKAQMPTGETQCTIYGWSIDIDPKGANVRAAPSIKAPVLGTLPPLVITHGGLDGSFGIRFRIIGSSNGWLKITDAEDDPSLSDLPLRPTYTGTGWIAANLVRFAVQSSRGYAKPNGLSTQLMGDDGWLDDHADIERVLACQGEWVLLDVRLVRRRTATEDLVPLPVAERRRIRAWFRRICGIQETTCDGPEDPFPFKPTP